MYSVRLVQIFPANQVEPTKAKTVALKRQAAKTKHMNMNTTKSHPRSSSLLSASKNDNCNRKALGQRCSFRANVARLKKRGVGSGDTVRKSQQGAK